MLIVMMLVLVEVIVWLPYLVVSCGGGGGFGSSVDVGYGGGGLDSAVDVGYVGGDGSEEVTG